MLDPVHLESFLAVAQTRNFTEAGRRLGLRQSTVSQHISKLEQASGRRLFVRDTHSVVPTADGEAMTGFAQSILEANARARDYFAGSQVRGRGGPEPPRISSVPACPSCCATLSGGMRWSILS